jgi:hypothetical protein
VVQVRLEVTGKTGYLYSISISLECNRGRNCHHCSRSSTTWWNVPSLDRNVIKMAFPKWYGSLLLHLHIDLLHTFDYCSENVTFVFVGLVLRIHPF